MLFSLRLDRLRRHGLGPSGRLGLQALGLAAGLSQDALSLAAGGVDDIVRRDPPG